jgi:hypothetical protein
MALTQKERDWVDCHFNKLNDRITEVRVDIAGLKVKAGVWGLIGGAIPVIVTIAIYLIIRGW